MKQIITLTLSLILISCTSQATELPTATLALPTQTPIPTPTLHPEFIELQNLIADSSENLALLPNGQIEENGVVIPNLQVDPNGEITILVEGENIVVNSADITFKDGFDINGYELNDDGEWVEVVKFESMDLSVENIGVCDYNGDVFSGRLAWNVEQAVKNGDILFPVDAHNAGWENRQRESNSAPMYLDTDSKNAMQHVNTCSINMNFLDLPDREAFVATVAVINTDGTIGVLHFIINNKKTLDWFVDRMRNDGDVGITKELVKDIIEDYWDGPFAATARIYGPNGNNAMTLLNQLQSTGVVSPELERRIVAPSGR